jgi:hypothetical protein
LARYMKSTNLFFSAQHNIHSKYRFPLSRSL